MSDERAVTIHPLTPERWPDLETLFGARGASGGCWCMWWRLPRAQYETHKGAENRSMFAAIVAAGDTPGLLAYTDGHPIGWCAIAPREEYPRLDRSRILRRVDARPVWSVSCLFVAKPYRRRGVSVRLLEAAVRFAHGRGATTIEGYPTEPATGMAPDAFIWTGAASAFRAAGFVEVARRAETRPIMRYDASEGTTSPEACRD